MNPKTIKLTFIVVVFLGLLVGYVVIHKSMTKETINDDPCEEKFSTYPGFSIYKTKNDYFDKVSCSCRDSQIERIPVFNIGDPSYYFDEDTVYKFRKRLCKGYVLDKLTFYHDVFLDIDIHDYYLWELKNNAKGLPLGLVEELIIEENPFKEYWYVKNSDKGSFTLREINQLISENKLESYFKRLK